VARFRRALRNWSSGSRREFLWRDACATPYVVLASEMLLRKTRAASVEPVVAELLAEYPQPRDLARARLESLEDLLRPLGLHRVRARALKDVGERLASRHRGRVPRLEADLLELPHVGRYAANAVLCFSYGQRRAIVDANVVRIYHRVFGIPVPRETHKADDLWGLAQRALPRTWFQKFNLALLDLGGLVCLPRLPLCAECPLVTFCPAHGGGDCGCMMSRRRQGTSKMRRQRV
jgi:A/G-specific adenine glycosylase